MKREALNYETRDYQCIKGLKAEGLHEYRMLCSLNKAKELSTQLGINYSTHKNRNGQVLFKFTW